MSTSELISKIRELKELKSYAEEIAEEITAFKKTHADLYAQYTKQTESRRFSIT